MCMFVAVRAAITHATRTTKQPDCTSIPCSFGGANELLVGDTNQTLGQVCQLASNFVPQYCNITVIVIGQLMAPRGQQPLHC